jgi:hypothetical protein
VEGGFFVGRKLAEEEGGKFGLELVTGVLGEVGSHGSLRSKFRVKGDATPLGLEMI